MASDYLTWPENLGTESKLWDGLSAEEARSIATERTAKAAYRLSALNHEKDTYVVNAQALLLWACLSLGVALALSFWSPRAPSEDRADQGTLDAPTLPTDR